VRHRVLRVVLKFELHEVAVTNTDHRPRNRAPVRPERVRGAVGDLAGDLHDLEVHDHLGGILSSDGRRRGRRRPKNRLLDGERRFGDGRKRRGFARRGAGRLTRRLVLRRTRHSNAAHGREADMATHSQNVHSHGAAPRFSLLLREHVACQRGRRAFSADSARSASIGAHPVRRLSKKSQRFRVGPPWIPAPSRPGSGLGKTE
jgi:hypothetical protein